MTNREFYTMIAENDTLPTEIREFAVEAIGKLDKRNSARADKPSKTAVANEPIKAQILELLTAQGGVMVASEIATALEISVQKASALCRQMVEGGALDVSEIKVPKRGKQKAYSIAC